MKSYLLAFGCFPQPKSVYILDRSEPNENFSEKRRHQKNYAFPAGIQGLNYEKVNFFTEPPQNGRILDLQLSHFTGNLRVLFCPCNWNIVNCQGNGRR